MTRAPMPGGSRFASPAAILEALIRCPSVTPAEAGALALIESLLAPAGFSVERPIFRAPGTPDVENLFASIGSGTPHLVFAGHVDVVPPGPEARWRHPPFSGALEGGMIHGRGAVDMKGAIACFIAAALDFCAKGGLAKGQISFLITGDEEGPAINGTAKLLALATEHGHRFDAALVGEPTNPNQLGEAIKIGRRGSLSGTIIVAGKQGHAAYPELADNPIPTLLRLATALQAERLDEGTAEFQPSNLEITSVDVGNAAFNVIPAEAQLRFNIRFNDGWSVERLKHWLKTRLDSAARGKSYSLNFEPNPAEAFLTRSEKLIVSLTQAIREVTGREARLSTNGGTSDARFIKDYCPVVEFGLVGKTMHQIDEHVPLADLEGLSAIYRCFLEGFFVGG